MEITMKHARKKNISENTST